MGEDCAARAIYTYTFGAWPRLFEDTPTDIRIPDVDNHKHLQIMYLYSAKVKDMSIFGHPS
jgi:hypothetical protein